MKLFSIWQWIFPIHFYQTNVAAAVVGAAVVGGTIAASGAEGAADTQANAANRATDLQEGNLQQTQANLKPYMDSGLEAQTSLKNLLGVGAPTNGATYGSLNKPFDTAAFQANVDPGYQWQLQQGQNALQNSQAAQNGVLGGAALKDLIGYNQGMANTAYQGAFDRWNVQNTNTYNRLSAMLGIGENAAAGVGNVGAQTSANIGNTIMSAGNAQAAGIVGQSNAINGAINAGTGYYMMNNASGGKLFGGNGITTAGQGADLGGGVSAPSGALSYNSAFGD